MPRENRNNKNYDYKGKIINNMEIIDVFYENKKRGYIKYPIRIYYAKCRCLNCGAIKTFTMKYLKEHVLKNNVKEDFYCQNCGNFKESSSYKRVFKKPKIEEGENIE